MRSFLDHHKFCIMLITSLIIWNAQVEDLAELHTMSFLRTQEKMRSGGSSSVERTEARWRLVNGKLGA